MNTFEEEFRRFQKRIRLFDYTYMISAAALILSIAACIAVWLFYRNVPFPEDIYFFMDNLADKPNKPMVLLMYEFINSKAFSLIIVLMVPMSLYFLVAKDNTQTLFLFLFLMILGSCGPTVFGSMLESSMKGKGINYSDYSIPAVTKESYREAVGDKNYTHIATVLEVLPDFQRAYVMAQLYLKDKNKRKDQAAVRAHLKQAVEAIRSREADFKQYNPVTVYRLEQAYDGKAKSAMAAKYIRQRTANHAFLKNLSLSALLSSFCVLFATGIVAVKMHLRSNRIRIGMRLFGEEQLQK